MFWQGTAFVVYWGCFRRRFPKGQNKGGKYAFFVLSEMQHLPEGEKYLAEHQISCTERNIKEENPTAEELRTWIKASGLPVKKFFNTSGMLYKELKLRDRLPSMTEEEQIELLATDGMLVKRPLLIDGSRVLVGFRAEEYGKLAEQK